MSAGESESVTESQDVAVPSKHKLSRTANDYRDRAARAGCSYEAISAELQSLRAADPKISEIPRETLFATALGVHSLGLSMSKGLGHVHLVPMSSNGVPSLEVIIGYHGLAQLAWRSQAVVGIHADVIRPGDEFSKTVVSDFGTERGVRLVHETSDPAARGEDALPAPASLGAYAVIYLARGPRLHQGCDGIGESRVPVVEHMTAAEIGEIRDAALGKSRRPERSPWATNFQAMAKKTVLRSALQMVPGFSSPLGSVESFEEE
jgi:recombination protein RecT